LGNQARIVVTEGFLSSIESSACGSLAFHDRQEIEVFSFGTQTLYLASTPRHPSSLWDELPGISDAAMLRRALNSGRTLDVVYRAKRLLEIRPRDRDAINALRVIAQSGQMTVPKDRNTLLAVVLDEHFGPTFVQAGTLIERLRGENICVHGEEGLTMFIILRGQVGVFLPRPDEEQGCRSGDPDFVMQPGELAGELAFALRRKRTATLRCLENTALLTFSHDEFLRAIGNVPGKDQLEEMVSRKILSRIIENVWNTAKFFCDGAKESIPVSGQLPWLELQPHCRVHTLPRREGVIKALENEFRGDGFCFLISGQLQVRATGKILSGETYPPLWIRVPEFTAIRQDDCLMLGDVTVLYIERAGLMQLGNEAYTEIVNRVNKIFLKYNERKTQKMNTDGLLKISGCDDPDRSADVIFVHGLDGDAISTWHPKGDVDSFWPKWLGEELPAVGIWSLGYAVSSSAWKGSTMPLYDRAINTLDKLELDGLGTRPVIFVCHSLGGLLVKQMLRCAHDFGNADYRRIADQTKAIIFLSTPHTGADMASWLSHIGTLLRTTVSVEELQAHHPRLRELNVWYRNFPSASSLKTLVYCEKKSVAGILVVNEVTADPGIAGVIPIPVDEDHISICKPQTKGSQIYRRVKRLIEEVVSAAEPDDAFTKRPRP
jgi:CRP-like cAMP-binding protein